jgi:molybdopterin-guanine dinucleotide biosynthesis protein A
MLGSESGLVAGYILAGGESRRMGRDKALLAENGVPLLKKACDTVRAAVGRCSVVAPAGRYEGLGLPVLADLWPGEGPLGGILTALGSGEAEWALIVAVDMPFLESGFLLELLRQARLAGRTTVPVRENGGLEPLCGVYHAGDLAGLRRFFDTGGRRVKDALREIGAATVAAPARLLENVNTPEQWEAVRG